MQNRLPGWIIALLAGQLTLTLFLFALGWSHTSSMTFGRTPPLVDILLLAVPSILVLACAVAAWVAWRRNARPTAKIMPFLPLPLSILVYGLSGAVV